jgi:hypothetical protein
MGLVKLGMAYTWHGLGVGWVWNWQSLGSSCACHGLGMGLVWAWAVRELCTVFHRLVWV